MDGIAFVLAESDALVIPLLRRIYEFYGSICNFGSIYYVSSSYWTAP